MANVKACFQTPVQSNKASLALLVLRVIVGVAFIYHGSMKIQNPFAWAPAGMPMPIPGIGQALAAVSEFGGGIALVLGLLTPLASLGIFITMSVAAGMHKFVLGDPFVNLSGGSSYELALVFWGIMLVFMALGPGKYSADSKIFGNRKN